MKKIITIFMMLAMAVTSFASEKTVTISRDEGQFSDESKVYYGVKDGIILTMTGGMNNVNYLLANPNTNFTILSYNYTITKVVFHCLDDAVEGDLDANYWGPSTISLYRNHTHPDNPGTYTSSGYIGTWEGESSSLNFAVKGKGVRFGSIEITYDKNEGDIYQLVTSRDQIVDGKSYVIVSQNYDKAMRFKEAADVTPPATPIVEWMNENKTRVKVDGNAMVIRMAGVKDSTYSSYTRKVAWFKLGNGYLRGQNDYLTVNSAASDYGRAIMYFGTASNYLCWFKMGNSNSTHPIRYDYNNDRFMIMDYNDASSRVWLYKQAEEFAVNTAVEPADKGSITLLDGVVNGKSQEGETVNFSTEATTEAAAEGWGVKKVVVKNITTGEETVLLQNRSQQLSFEMPASDMLVTAYFELITGIENVERAAQVTGVEYVNLIGVTSRKPFTGLNIVRTTYSDGTVKVTKVVK